MTNATQDKQRTAVELFNTGDEGTIRRLTRKLIRLLNNESDFYFWDEEETKHLTLKEFQNNFEWDESYSVKASYGVEMLNDYIQTIECPTKEDALAWVNGENELEEPDLYDFYPEFEFNGEERICLVVGVSNLRLKTEQPKKQYEWTIRIEPSFNQLCAIKRWVEETEYKLLTNQQIKIVDSVLKPIEEATSGSEET